MRRATVFVLVMLIAGATACASPGGLSAANQELAAYLASMYRAQGDLLAASADLMPTGDDLDADDEQAIIAQQQEYAIQTDALLQEYVESLAAIEAPADAADLHAALITSAEQTAASTKRILDDLASGDIGLALQAQQDLTGMLQEVIADSAGLQREMVEMVRDVLAGRDDPESQYILELLALRTSGGIEAAQQLLGSVESAPTTADELGALIDQAVGALDAVLADYAAISPPDAWADVHAEQIALLEDGIALYVRFGEVLIPLLDDPESGDLSELQELLRNIVDWAGRGPVLNAAFSYQFADYFEGLA